MSIAEKLTAIAENEQKVYDAGKQAEYDRFWDAYQQNGNKQNYTAAFCGEGWTPETFVPKYDVKPIVAATHLFGQKAMMGCDLDEVATSVGIKIDFSECTNLSEVFFYSGVVKVGVIDTRSAESLHNTFSYGTLLETIRLLILRDDGSQTFNDSSFRNCVKLSDITIKGKIGPNVDFHWSPLSHGSCMSIIDALKDYSGTSTTQTLTLGTTNLAKLTDAEKAIATQKGWTLA